MLQKKKKKAVENAEKSNLGMRKTLSQLTG